VRKVGGVVITRYQAVQLARKLYGRDGPVARAAFIERLGQHFGFERLAAELTRPMLDHGIARALELIASRRQLEKLTTELAGVKARGRRALTTSGYLGTENYAHETSTPVPLFADRKPLVDFLAPEESANDSY
jgi:hypothetical protein